MNFYESLGIKKNATPSEVHKAYRRKAKQIHPDYNHKNTAFYEMVELNLIRDTLLNPEKRREYDAQIHQKISIPQAPENSRAKNDVVDYVRELFTFRCRVCGQKMSSTWQGYCLFHFLEVSGQLSNPDQTFIYHGVTYTWQSPSAPPPNTQRKSVSSLVLTLYLIFCLVVLALIIYNIYSLWTYL